MKQLQGEHYYLRWANTHIWTVGRWSGYEWEVLGDSWGHDDNEFDEAVRLIMPGKTE